MQITRDMLNAIITNAAERLQDPQDRETLLAWSETAVQFNCAGAFGCGCPMVQTGVVDWTAPIAGDHWHFIFAFDAQIMDLAKSTGERFRATEAHQVVD
jgi:hypothetical protein